jgi:hypothetical protein
MKGWINMFDFKALMAVQKELNAPKNQYNSFGKYKYRSCEDIIEAAKPLCIKNGLALCISDTVVNMGDRYYIEATVTLYDALGNSHSTKALAREENDKKGMDASQLTGSTSSYARKYALNGLFAIDDSKDADTDEHAHTTKQQPKQSVNKSAPSKLITSKEGETLVTLALQKGTDIAKLMAYYKVTELGDMTVEQYKQATEALNKKEDAHG